MRKALWFSISAAIAGALLFAVSGCGPGADTGYTGTVSYSWVTPDLLPTYAGYYEGNQTITMENGIATKAVAEMVVFLGEPWTRALDVEVSQLRDASGSTPHAGAHHPPGNLHHHRHGEAGAFVLHSHDLE